MLVSIRCFESDIQWEGRREGGREEGRERGKGGREEREEREKYIHPENITF